MWLTLPGERSARDNFDGVGAPDTATFALDPPCEAEGVLAAFDDAWNCWDEGVGSFWLLLGVQPMPLPSARGGAERKAGRADRMAPERGNTALSTPK